jgi:hypothetical protein
VAALLGAVADAGLRGEDWSGSLRALCTACDAGEVHDHPAATDWRPERRVGIAGDPERVAGILDRWAAAGPARSWHA